MTRAFLDTNVLLDIELRRPRRYAAIREASEDEAIVALVSLGVLEELRDVLERDPELVDLRAATGLSVDDVVRSVLEYTKLSGGFDFVRRVLPRDPRDEHVLAAALAGEADYLVTSNIVDFEDAPVTLRTVTPDEFLDVLTAL